MKIDPDAKAVPQVDTSNAVNLFCVLTQSHLLLPGNIATGRPRGGW
jgi:hypothetical protein